jgi:threonine/homoserine/homoserine lactone efflux protein
VMAATLIAWFLGVSIVFTSRPVRERFLAMGRWFNRVTGAMFIGLGVRLALQQAKAG